MRLSEFPQLYTNSHVDVMQFPLKHLKFEEESIVRQQTIQNIQLQLTELENKVKKNSTRVIKRAYPTYSGEEEEIIILYVLDKGKYHITYDPISISDYPPNLDIPDINRELRNDTILCIIDDKVVDEHKNPANTLDRLLDISTNGKLSIGFRSTLPEYPILCEEAANQGIFIGRAYYEDTNLSCISERPEQLGVHALLFATNLLEDVLTAVQQP